MVEIQKSQFEANLVVMEQNMVVYNVFQTKSCKCDVEEKEDRAAQQRIKHLLYSDIFEE